MTTPKRKQQQQQQHYHNKRMQQRQRNRYAYCGGGKCIRKTTRCCVIGIILSLGIWNMLHFFLIHDGPYYGNESGGRSGGGNGDNGVGGFDDISSSNNGRWLIRQDTTNENDKQNGSSSSKSPSTSIRTVAQGPSSISSTAAYCPEMTQDIQDHGVYHIAIADIEGGVGTALYQLVILQLQYADMYQLTPIIHFTHNVSKVIDDPMFWNNGPSMKTTWTVKAAPITRRQGQWHRRHITPGPPLLNETKTKQITITGTGIWQHYFEPVSNFTLQQSQSNKNNDSASASTCPPVPYVSMGLEDIHYIIPGLHGFDEHAIRCWRYDYLPEYVSQPHQSLYTWLEPQRYRASAIIQKYIRVKPYLQQRAKTANPNCNIQNPCLGLHIRHSDKAAGRRIVEVSEFWPYVQAFLHHGGQYVYVATDSDTVLDEIWNQWPEKHSNNLLLLPRKLRRAPSLVRSNTTTAVFDVTQSHHQTNQDAIVEILALSYCQFLIHGHSAISEAAIWNNIHLHRTSVNLEDEHHLPANVFADLVDQVVNQQTPPSLWPKPTHYEDDWPPPGIVNEFTKRETSHKACVGYDGVLLITSGGTKSQTASAIFTSILNQLLFADQHNLLPWIHLRPESNPILYDELVHNATPSSSSSTEDNGKTLVKEFDMMHGMAVSVKKLQPGNLLYPNQPAKKSSLKSQRFRVPPGNGIWNTYLEPVSDFTPGDESCNDKPLIEMEEILVSPGMDSYAPWSIKAWRYDMLHPSILPDAMSDGWLKPMRERAQELVRKYFRFRPYLMQRVKQVNAQDDSFPCLAVHLRMADKTGKHRRKVKAGEYREYLEAFARAGGKRIYLATDTQRPLQFIRKNFPETVQNITQTQGDHIVRSVVGDYPTHILDRHHRVNSETLVDILALSQCSLILHTYSTVSEAAMYLNPEMQNVNLEDPSRMSAKDFEMLSRYVLGVDDVLQKAAPADDSVPLSTEKAFEKPRIIRRRSSEQHVCRTNAVVYLAQKLHSSYGRDSYSSLLSSLDLLSQNYLSIDDHMSNTDIFIFHTGDFNRTDLDIVEGQIPSTSAPNAGAVHLVDLSNTRFWARPSSNLRDDPQDWYAWPLFSEGYRRMMHWFAIDIWDFFASLNRGENCQYRYLFRLDEDSFLHSPIQYDIFDLMKSQQYVYGFRMCAYEMKVTQRMSTLWIKRHENSFVPQRELDLDMCGFYNNFFVADLDFFTSPPVSQFLKFIDRQGHIYRRRLGDLMIHSMAVYWFAPSTRIHRFLDFTYEHSTLNQTNGCLLWGGIQAGYDDPHAAEILGNFNRTMTVDRGCPVNSSSLTFSDLSPTYSHLPDSVQRTVSLPTITAGNVELPAGKGILSG